MFSPSRVRIRGKVFIFPRRADLLASSVVQDSSSRSCSGVNCNDVQGGHVATCKRHSTSQANELTCSGRSQRLLATRSSRNRGREEMPRFSDHETDKGYELRIPENGNANAEPVLPCRSQPWTKQRTKKPRYPVTLFSEMSLALLCPSATGESTGRHI